MDDLRVRMDAEQNIILAKIITGFSEEELKIFCKGVLRDLETLGRL